MGILNKMSNSQAVKSDTHIRCIRSTSSITAPKEAETLARSHFRLVNVFKDRNEYVWVFQHDWVLQRLNEIVGILTQDSH